jgi:hypothetical protein
MVRRPGMSYARVQSAWRSQHGAAGDLSIKGRVEEGSSGRYSGKGSRRSVPGARVLTYSLLCFGIEQVDCSPTALIW